MQKLNLNVYLYDDFFSAAVRGFCVIMLLICSICCIGEIFKMFAII